MTPAAPDPGPHWPGWLGAALKGMVLIGGLFALGGALTLFAIGLLANGRGIAALDFSWTMFGFSLAAGAAQAGLALLGCRTAWAWITARTASDAAPAATDPD